MTKDQKTFRTCKTLVSIFNANSLLGLVVFLTAVVAIAYITVSFSLKKLLDSALAGDLVTFKQMILVLCGLTLIQMIATYLKTYFIGKYTHQGVALIRSMMTNTLVRLSITELEKKHSGDITSRMSNDLNKISEFAKDTLPQVIYQPLSAIGAICYLLTLNWKLTLISTLIVPFIFKFSATFTNPIARYTKELQEKLALINKEVQDTITGMESVRAYGLQSILGQKHDQAVNYSVKTALKVIFIRCMLTSLSSFVSALPFFICFGFGGYWVVQGEMTAGSLIAFITLLNPLTYPIGQMPTLLGNLKGEMVAADRIIEILNLPKEREGGEDYAINLQVPVVVFKDVVFAYSDDGTKVLDKVSFEIMPGEKVAVVGLSGGGKSTIFKLILGYYVEFAGEIEIFGHSLHEWNLCNLRDKISLVAQDTYLFPGTIEENIAVGQNGASSEEIIAAAKAANAHGFISELRDGYQSDVGEFGDKLSGGQRQRISISRAILKNAQLLLLDEATSSLDTYAEAIIQEALDKYIGSNLTCMIIGHRLSTIQNADRILVLEDGKIVETGSHKELMNKNGIYKNLYEHQFYTEVQTEEKEVAM